MSTKMIGVVGRGSGWQKVGIELGSYIFHPNSSQPGMFQTLAKCYLKAGVGHPCSPISHDITNVNGLDLGADTDTNRKKGVTIACR